MAALPPVPFKVKAIAPYSPSSATELALVVGQVYEVTSTDGKGVWVQSQVNGVVGWFPFNYTQVVPNDTAANHGRSLSASGSANPVAVAAQPVVAATPATQTTSTALKKKPEKEKKERPTKPGPPLRSHVEKNKQNLPTTVLVHRTLNIFHQLTRVSALGTHTDTTELCFAFPSLYPLLQAHPRERS